MVNVMMLVKTLINNRTKILKKYFPTSKITFQMIYEYIRKFPNTICPRCIKPAYGKQDNEKKFGGRLVNYLYNYKQSWCKECMHKRKNETIRALNIRRLKNVFLIMLIKFLYSKN